MRRVLFVALIASIGTWQTAGAQPPEPTTPAPTTTAPPDTTTTTSPPETTTTTTTTVPPATTTTSPTTTTTTSPPTTATTSPSTTTTTTTPATSPSTTTTTTSETPPTTTTTTTVPTATTTPAAPSEDVDGAHPPEPAVDAGQLRPITFPVAGPVTYVDDFGACRDGCRRSHMGNDVIGDRLQPLLAMHDGVIDHLVDHPTAGYGVVIRDREGWEYHVYHVNNDTPGTDDGGDDGRWRYADGIVPGARVVAGQLIGFMGDSGNSEGSVPHAHVEIHRPDGVAINPYPSLRHAQRHANCRITGQAAPLSASVDDGWLDTGWSTTELPSGWVPLALTAGHPGSTDVAARMWVAAVGLTPVDAAALHVGDVRYDQAGDCRPDHSRISTLPADAAVVLAVIRAMESSGDYTAASQSSTASGAYQFVDSTWGGYGGYARALDAPPAIQDAKAAEWATAILDRNAGDVTAVPVSWYLGHVPVAGEWDRIPPYPGNTLTPRQYQQRWMATYTELLGDAAASIADASASTAVDAASPCHTVIVDVGTPDDPALVLTQAQRFVPNPTGRATPASDDPCYPTRQAPTRPSAAPTPPWAANRAC
jgi:hypothetical protein